MSNTMKKIVTVLLMVVFTVLAAGCENQDEKFKRLESELYNFDKKIDVQMKKAKSDLDFKSFENTKDEFAKKSMEIINDMVKTAKGNVKLEVRADEIKQYHEKQIARLNSLTYETLKKEKFENVRKQIHVLQQNFDSEEHKLVNVKDRSKYEPLVKKYIADANPLIEQLNKIAAGDKTMMKEAESYNQIHKSYITAIENNRFDDLIQARQGHKHKSLGEDKYKDWFK